MKKVIMLALAAFVSFSAFAQSKTTVPASKATTTAKPAISAKDQSATKTTTATKPAPAAAKVSTAATSKDAATTATITIQTNASPQCKTCINNFKENVPYFKGVKDYTYDAKTTKLTITYNPSKTTPDQLRKEVSKLGYDADNVKADAAARAKLPACCKSGKACDSNSAPAKTSGK